MRRFSSKLSPFMLVPRYGLIAGQDVTPCDEVVLIFVVEGVGYYAQCRRFDHSGVDLLGLGL